MTEQQIRDEAERRYPNTQKPLRMNLGEMQRNAWNACAQWLLSQQGGTATKPEKTAEYGEWQVCPICQGAGEFQQTHGYGIEMTVGIMPCHLCNGAKVIARPQSPSLRDALEDFENWIEENKWMRQNYERKWVNDNWSKEKWVNNPHLSLPEVFELYIQAKALLNNNTMTATPPNKKE